MKAFGPSVVRTGPLFFFVEIPLGLGLVWVWVGVLGFAWVLVLLGLFGFYSESRRESCT